MVFSSPDNMPLLLLGLAVVLLLGAEVWRRAAARARAHADASLEHYRTRYREGLVDILDLLNAEQSAFDARSALLEVRQNRLINRITLGLALGMGV